MIGDPEVCYRALKSRDARFDGRFFVGVTTTGIYCRPICPAPTPLFKNIRFFACAAAAEGSGFRPCRRCFPEASPGTPAWLGTSSTVSRALRLISSGFLDENNIDELARRLGVGDRHLRRLFATHLGASPVDIVQTRKVHFARRLIDETTLPMMDIAYSSGFGSVRSFNESIRKSFGRTPTKLRQLARRKEPVGLGSDIVLQVPYRPPYNWSSIIEFLAARAIPGVESVTRDSYRRTIVVGTSQGIAEVCPSNQGPFLLLRLQLCRPRQLLHIVERFRRIFDTGADPAEIANHLSFDPRLLPIVERYPGLRVPGAWDGFELAVRAILGQQVSVKAASSLAGKLVRMFGEKRSCADDERLTQLFPPPETLARSDLTRLGMPRARAQAIRELARRVSTGEILLDASLGVDEVVERLSSVPGVGAWTAQYIAMRALREPDAFPASDLGLRRVFVIDSKFATPSQLASAAEEWRPWRAYAAMYLWKTLETRRTGGLGSGGLGPEVWASRAIAPERSRRAEKPRNGD